jgi:hypothetical protein
VVVLDDFSDSNPSGSAVSSHGQEPGEATDEKSPESTYPRPGKVEEKVTTGHSAGIYPSPITLCTFKADGKSLYVDTSGWFRVTPKTLDQIEIETGLPEGTKAWSGEELRLNL